MSTLTIRPAKAKLDYAGCVLIRYKVFVVEQKVDETIEMDEYEDSCEHIVALEKNKAVGCARLRPVKDKIKIERLAVLKEYRGKGYGGQILRYLIARAKRKKPEGIYMNAQYYLLDYYRKFGFVPAGEKFDEAGIEHIKMILDPKKPRF